MEKHYSRIPNLTGIYHNASSGSFMSTKRLNGKLYQKSFESLAEAQYWRQHFKKESKSYSTLKDVWKCMQEMHFPTLALSTINIWKRRYILLQELEHLSMNEITSSQISSWIIQKVILFKDESYQSLRGNAGRCNLNNELNLLVTIFYWYKQSDVYEKEAIALTCPVKKKHREQGFIKPIPDRRKNINLDHTLVFLEELKPLYKDLATLQFYCAARIGEVAGLQWSCIDFKNRRMLIKHTCLWDNSSKKFTTLKNFPKNKETRPVFITQEIMEILERRSTFRLPGNNFVFHVDGRPLNYGTIQVNYRNAQRKSGIPYTGTHILRHGMAKLARKVGGGLDAVVAMTGHKDLKLANYYSKCDEEDQKHISEKIMEHIRLSKYAQFENFDNVVSLNNFKKD